MAGLPYPPTSASASQETGPPVLERRKSSFLHVGTTDAFLFPSCRARAEAANPRPAPRRLRLPHITKDPGARGPEPHPGAPAGQQLTSPAGGQTKLTPLKCFTPTPETSKETRGFKYSHVFPFTKGFTLTSSVKDERHFEEQL